MTDETRVFVDSNVWIYALTDQDVTKGEISRQLISRFGDRICFSVQVVNEVCVNLKRKHAVTEADVRKLVNSFFLKYQFAEVTSSVMKDASVLRERHSFSFWDSLILMTALHSGATTLFSQDMQHNFVLDDKIRIIDPFADES